MITDAVVARTPTAWVAADEAYGDNGAFRARVAALGLGYVVAVSCTHRIPAFPGGRRRLRAGRIAAALPAGCWHRISAGTGSKGTRWYDWAWVSAHQDGHSLLIRRGSSGELAFYRCWSPSPVTLATLVRVAGSRWAVEEGFLLQGSSGCGMTLHQTLRGEFLQHVSVGVVLVVAAALTPAVFGQALSCNTCGVTTRL